LLLISAYFVSLRLFSLPRLSLLAAVYQAILSPDLNASVVKELITILKVIVVEISLPTRLEILTITPNGLVIADTT